MTRPILAACALALVVATLSGCGICLNCGPDYRPPARIDPELLKLSAFMTGSFTSADQAADDPRFRPITLEMTRIWRHEPDHVWLYVEQALESRRDRPYRQRVYRLSRVDSVTFASDVYLLADDAAWIGAWSDPALFDASSPADLTLKEGCAVRLERINSWTYAGSTGERTCPSELYGASHASSEVTVKPGRVESWDRGWDDEGKQIWGSEAGPYVFIRSDRRTGR